MRSSTEHQRDVATASQQDDERGAPSVRPGSLPRVVAAGGRLRVLLLTSPATYRAGAFISAAERLGLDVGQAIDMPATLTDYWRVELGLDFTRPDEATARHQISASHAGVDADSGRARRVVDEIEEAALVGPKRSVFGQVTPGLAHQPYR